VKVNWNRILASLIIVSGLFAVSVVTALFIPRAGGEEGPSLLAAALISGGVVAAAALPFLLWLAVKPVKPDQYSAYALEEIELDEKELNDAVGNWVYARYRKRAEEDARFLEDEDGSVSCRVTVRKD